MREECITIPMKAGVEAVASLRQEMLRQVSSLKPGDSLILDFASLERFDTSLGQLIESLKKTVALKGVNLVFREMEPHKNIHAMLSCDSLQETNAGGIA